MDRFCCPHRVHSSSPTWSPDSGQLCTLCMDPWTTCGFLEDSSRNPQVVPSPLTETSLFSSCGRNRLWKLWINSMWTSCPQHRSDPVDGPVDNLGNPQVWILQTPSSEPPQAVSDTPVDASDTPTAVGSGEGRGRTGDSSGPSSGLRRNDFRFRPAPEVPAPASGPPQGRHGSSARRSRTSRRMVRGVVRDRGRFGYCLRQVVLNHAFTIDGPRFRLAARGQIDSPATHLPRAQRDPLPPGTGIPKRTSWRSRCWRRQGRGCGCTERLFRSSGRRPRP